MSKNTVYHLQMPVTEEQVRALRVGDVVYLAGTVFTARDQAHEHLIELGKKGKKAPFDLRGGAIWHCGPVARKDKHGVWEVTSIGPTTSYRLTNETPYILKNYGVRFIVGKGGMGQPTVKAMKECGAAFLAATGGCAIIHAENVKKVNQVYWEKEFGLPEAVWELTVKDFGAMIVAIDSTGATLYEAVMDQAKKKMAACYKKIGVKDPARAMIHWPPALSGTKDSNILEGMTIVSGGA